MTFKTNFRGPLICATAVVALSAGAAAAGHLTYYKADLLELNGSGVTGSGFFVYDDTAKTLSVDITASGLYDANRTHAMHIHGLDGADSVSPPSNEADIPGADGDGFVELAEAFPFYGDVLVPLTQTDGTFSQAPGGMLSYSRLFDLTDSSIYNGSYDISDLMPAMLENREIVIHGGFVSGSAGGGGVPGRGTPGEIDGTGGYKAFLPVATAEIYRTTSTGMPAVPLPASLPLLAAGFGALGLVARRRASKKS